MTKEPPFKPVGHNVPEDAAAGTTNPLDLNRSVLSFQLPFFQIFQATPCSPDGLHGVKTEEQLKKEMSDVSEPHGVELQSCYSVVDQK